MLYNKYVNDLTKKTWSDMFLMLYISYGTSDLDESFHWIEKHSW